MQQPPLPPFTRKSAGLKTQTAADAWNTRDLKTVVQASSPGCMWRCQGELFQGTAAITFLLRRKWAVEWHYQLANELWAYTDNRIALRSEYQWQHAESGQWYRSYGNEHWEFNADGYMTRCNMSANDIEISASERTIGFLTP